MSKTAPVVFLFDVDNTLLDNDLVQCHLKEHLADAYGASARDRYWEILEGLRTELGYVDYLGALERFRVEEIHRPGRRRSTSADSDSLRRRTVTRPRRKGWRLSGPARRSC